MKSFYSFFMISVIISSCQWDLDNISTCQCKLPILDSRDQQEYEVVWIDIDGGNDRAKAGQCWMQENLDFDFVNNEQFERYCYEDSIELCNLYGGLYTWNTSIQASILEGVQGICPKGWRLPSHDDFEQLLTNLGVSSNLTNECEGTGNSEGFYARFAGYRDYLGNFTGHIDFARCNHGTATSFWTSTKVSDNPTAFNIMIDSDSGTPLIRTNFAPANEGRGASVRCICNQ